tara:strand:+ start:45 stop:623 length:579 start_codon:yes stop_codon:yes gene_type:complete
MDVLTMLNMPFSQAEVDFRQGGGGRQLAYIDARTVMKRLDDVMGIDGWQDSYRSIENRTICELSLKINGAWVTKCDGAGDTKIEGAKGGISDSFKRAAVKFGIGRYLYYLEKNVNSFEQMPDWAKQSTKRPDKELMQKVLIALLDAIESDDSVLAKEAMQGLSEREQSFIWSMTSSKQKSAIHSLTYTEEAA